MVRYINKKTQYARKARRITKYGRYSRPDYAVMAPRYVKGKRGIRKIPVPKYLNPFSKSQELVQLMYHQDITLDPTPSTIGALSSNRWSFCFNDLYDTDSTSIGHQPMYFDNYANLYERYQVTFAKIQVTVVNHFVNTATATSAGTTTTQPNYSYKLAIVRDSNFNDLPNKIEEIIEQNAKNVSWRYVSPQLNGTLPKLSMKCAPHKQHAVSYGDDTLQSATNSGPAKKVFGSIIITSADGVTNPPSVSLAVKIKYYVKFFDRRMAQTEN